MIHTDICIAGAGIIGLSLAMELHARGLRVVVLEAGIPMREASTAAAGMLAAADPHNPAELSALSQLSIALYPKFLDRLNALGGIAVPFQTNQTLQATELSPRATLDPLLLTSSDEINLPSSSGFHLLHEHSVDPRQLATSLLAAVRSTPITLIIETTAISTNATSNAVSINIPKDTIAAAHFIDCSGAWASNPAYRVLPIKGQMLAVALPEDFPLQVTVRTRDIYIVPRITGPNAGRAIIGATVEDAGFNKTVHVPQIETLRHQAIALIPQLTHAPILESWSGLRPAAPDRLPLLGPHPSKPHHWVATGHYRNGILLAPATAHVLAQRILGESPSASLEAFDPSRLAPEAP